VTWNSCETILLQMNPARMDIDSIERAASVIRREGLVALPTETVYGLGGDALTP
jgi:L-threonylcarbamoyladenylate synthase